jgi:hypothetical protein
MTWSHGMADTEPGVRLHGFTTGPLEFLGHTT